MAMTQFYVEKKKALRCNAHVAKFSFLRTHTNERHPLKYSHTCFSRAGIMLDFSLCVSVSLSVFSKVSPVNMTRFHVH